MEPAYTVRCSDGDEAAWLAARWELLTASNVPRMLGLVKWIAKRAENGQPPETMADAVERVIREYAARKPLERSESMEYGRRAESFILKWAIETCPELATADASPGHSLLVSTRWPWLGCTLDAMAVFPEDPGPVVVEVKDYGQNTAKSWTTCYACEGRCGHEPAGERLPRLPDDVRCQVLTQLAVTGWPRGIVVGCERGKAPRCYPVVRDEPLLLAMVHEAEVVWNRIKALRAESEAAT